MARLAQAAGPVRDWYQPVEEELLERSGELSLGDEAEGGLQGWPAWVRRCPGSNQLKRKVALASTAALLACLVAVVCVAFFGAQGSTKGDASVYTATGLNQGLFSEKVADGYFCGGGRIALNGAANDYSCVALAIAHSQCRGYINYYPITEGCYCGSHEACTGENQRRSTSKSEIYRYTQSLTNTVVPPHHGDAHSTTASPQQAHKGGAHNASAASAGPAPAPASAHGHGDICEPFPTDAVYGCGDVGERWHKLAADGDPDTCISRCRTAAAGRGSICCLVRADIGCYMKPRAPVTSISGEDIGRATLCTEPGATPPTTAEPKGSTTTKPPQQQVATEAKWVFAQAGTSCTEGCQQWGLVCNPDEFAGHNFDVDSTDELGAVVGSLGGSCKYFGTQFGKEPDVPVYSEDSSWCGVSAAGRLPAEFSCDARPTQTTKETKKRLCWCSLRDVRPGEGHVPDARAAIMGDLGLQPVTHTHTTTSGVATTTPEQAPSADDYTGAVKSGDTVYLQAHTQNYVMVQGETVEARYPQRGEWQELTIVKGGGAVGDVINEGDDVFLRGATEKYIDVQGRSVRASSADQGTVQRFTAGRLGRQGPLHYQDRVFFQASTGKYLDVNPTNRFLEALYTERGDWQAFVISRKPV